MDTDDEVLENAYSTCYFDLKKAINKTLNEKDETTNYQLINNDRIKDRICFPSLFDRNGVFRAIQ